MKTSKLLFLPVLIYVLSGCGDESLPLGEVESVPPVASFSATVLNDNPNLVILDNTSQGEGIFAAWRRSANQEFYRDATPGQADTVLYPEAGTFEVTLLVGNDAGMDSSKMEITIANDLPPEGTVLGDFEDGQVGEWNAWGQDVSVVANPNPNSVNGSDNVLRMSQSEPWSTNAVRNIELINSSSRMVTIDAYFEVEGSLKFQIEQDFGTGYFLNVPAGEWVTLEYNLEGEYKAGEQYSWLVIQGNTAGTYYIDNITYFE